MKVSSNLGFVIAVCASVLAVPTPAAAQDKEIIIGTGSKSGVYYQVGRAMCRLLNADTREHGLTCEAMPTAGSIFNLTNVRVGRLEIGVAQSDWQFHAVNGSAAFESPGSDSDLRALFSVHSEPFTVMARRDSGISKFDHLRGKRVNIGNPGSGQRGTMEVVMKAVGWDKSVFSLANELPASQQSLALCHNRVQAMVYTVGHPNISVGQAAGLCDAVLVEVKGPAIDKLIRDNPFYAYTEIPGGIYAGNPDSVMTFGVKATVVTSSKLDEETAYIVVKSVFDNLDRFKKMHPAFGNLDPAKMVTGGLSAPLHEGALRYYREQGLM